MGKLDTSQEVAAVWARCSRKKMSMVMHRERHMVNLWYGIELVLFTIRGCQQSIYICGRHSSAGRQSHLLPHLFHHRQSSHICYCYVSYLDIKQPVVRR